MTEENTPAPPVPQAPAPEPRWIVTTAYTEIDGESRPKGAVLNVSAATAVDAIDVRRVARAATDADLAVAAIKR